MNVDSDSGGREFFFPTLTKCFLIGINTFWEDFRSNVVGLLPYNTEWTSARKLVKWIESNYSSYLKETMWSGLPVYMNHPADIAAPILGFFGYSYTTEGQIWSWAGLDLSYS